LDGHDQTSSSRLALTLGGGGARAAYQVGVLRAIARSQPQLEIPILTGVSAGAINIAHLANFEGNLADSIEALVDLWHRLRLENVFQTGGPSLLWRATKVGMRLSVGVPSFFAPVHGMVDTDPLRNYLCKALVSTDGNLLGIDRNIAAGKLQGVALATNSYATSETVNFFRGRQIDEWERPFRRSVDTQLTVEHVMASSALPLLFPPIQIGGHWYGDGGVRLIAPLAPAVHMGADKLIVISTHYIGEPSTPAITCEAPSPATVLSSMYNSVFLDQLDHDVYQMVRTNELVRQLAPDKRGGVRDIGLHVIRPSEDIGAIAFELKDRVPPMFRYLLNRLGGSEQSSDDLLSTMLFHPDYVQRLIEIGERDGESHAEQISRFVS
jgi:NTE family protein